MNQNIPEIPFGIPIQQNVAQNNSVSEKEKAELKMFDDIYYQQYREFNNFIPKDKLFESIINDLVQYLNTVPPCNEIRIGYTFYSKMTLTSSKMNNILNLLMQKINTNIRVQSMWEIKSSYKGPLQTTNGIENVDFDKMRLKILIRPNDKDVAIRKLVDISLSSMKKNNKKISDYLGNH